MVVMVRVVAIMVILFFFSKLNCLEVLEMTPLHVDLNMGFMTKFQVFFNRVEVIHFLDYT